MNKPAVIARGLGAVYPLWQDLLLLCVSWLATGTAGLLAVSSCLLLSQLGGVDHPASHGIAVRQASRMGGSIIAVFLLVGLLQAADAKTAQLPAIYPVGLLAVLGFYLLGLAEDIITDILPLLRLTLMALLATFFVLAAGHFASLAAAPIAVPTWFDRYGFLAIVAAIFWVTLLPNAFNIADGANGLIAGIALFVLLALIDSGTALGLPLATWELLVAGTLLFLLPNLLIGRIFLGDGGAYLLGAAVAVSILSVVSQTPELTLYFAALIFYPLMDLGWTIVRRVAVGRSPFVADEGHLHNCLHSYYRRHLSATFANSLTGLTIAVLFSGLPYWVGQQWGASAVDWGWIIGAQLAVYALLYRLLSR